MSGRLGDLIATLAANGGLRINVFPMDRGFQASVASDTSRDGWAIASDGDPNRAIEKALSQRASADLVSAPPLVKSGSAGTPMEDFLG